MVELHGWAMIRESFSADSEEDNIEGIADSLSHEIRKLRIDDKQLRIDFCNGEAVVTATKLANHFSDDVKGILHFFQRIACVAPDPTGCCICTMTRIRMVLTMLFRYLCCQREALHCTGILFFLRISRQWRRFDLRGTEALKIVADSPERQTI